MRDETKDDVIHSEGTFIVHCEDVCGVAVFEDDMPRDDLFVGSQMHFACVAVGGDDPASML